MCIPGNCMYEFICSVILLLITVLLLIASLPLNTSVLVLLLITVLLLIASLPLNTSVLVLLADFINPCFDFLFSNMCADFCNKISDSAMFT